MFAQVTTKRRPYVSGAFVRDVNNTLTKRQDLRLWQRTTSGPSTHRLLRRDVYVGWMRRRCLGPPRRTGANDEEKSGETGEHEFFMGQSSADVARLDRGKAP